MVRPQTADPKRRTPPKKPFTYEEFLEWADEDARAEWVDCEVIVMSPASSRHQQLVGFLVTLMGIYVEENALGQVLSAPFQMKLENGREPDVLFLKKEHEGRLKEAYLDGPADLVVEIVSPESGPRDRGEKFYEYEAGGVQEYWLIDPIREQIEVYRLEEGRYHLVQPEEEGIYRSEVVPGFWLRASWLWQESLPKVLGVLREWEVV